MIEKLEIGKYRQRDTEGQRHKMGAAQLSLASNLLLTILKIVVGILTGSVSVLAEAAHSMSDLLASGLTYISVRASDQPPDESHPYGHGKAESLSALAEAILLTLAAAIIIYEAIDKLMTHARPKHVGWDIIIMALAAFVNIFVVRVLLNVARQTGSQALKADAENHRADIYAAGGVCLGLLLVKVTGRGIFDPILAILVALLILRAAWLLARESFSPLMDGQLPEADVAVVRRVLDEDPYVLGYHKLRTRHSGVARFVDAHVMMDDNLTLQQAHDLTEDVERRVRDLLPHTEVTLHTEPYHAELQHQRDDHGILEEQN